MELIDAVKARLAEMRAVCDAATPGPVEVMDVSLDLEPSWQVLIKRSPTEYRGFAATNSEADAAFIAHARTWLPALIDYADGQITLTELARSLRVAE